MTESVNNERPDVEEIIRRIRRDIESAGNSIGLSSAAADPGDELRANLRAANAEVCGIRAVPGIKGFVRRIALKVLGVQRFNEHVVRVLNELVGMMEKQREPGARGNGKPPEDT